MKLYDEQIRDQDARRKRSSCGRKSEYTDEIGQRIVEQFAKDDTQTYGELAETLGMPASTVWNYACKFMDFRCLADGTRPACSDEQLLERKEQAKGIVDHIGPFKNEYHQDEKYLICNPRRRKRKVRRSDIKGSHSKKKVVSRRHQTQVMFSGCCGVGPDGHPKLVDFEWCSYNYTAKRKSKNHKRGEVYRKSKNMNKEEFTKVLDRCCKKIRSWTPRHIQPKLQIDSAGGHAMARSKKFFIEIRKDMLEKYNVLLVQQPGNTPMWNILDLVVWQGLQLEVAKMAKEERHNEESLAEVCEKAWRDFPLVKILRAFEMRRDVAASALENEADCTDEGKGRGGAHRVHSSPSYATLRAALGIETDPW